MALKDYFIISPFSSFRWVNENPSIDPRYGVLPLDSLQDTKFYAQPCRRIDNNLRLQVMTPYTTDTVTLHHYESDIQEGGTIPLTPNVPALLNQPFVCLNLEFDFSATQPGLYYAKYTYTDENNVVQDWRSNPLDIQDDFLDWDGQPLTFLYEATNTYNDKGVVFTDNGNPIVFAYRLEAAWYDPLVKGQVSNYDDQYYNLTQESYIPYETITNYIGNAKGIPFWYVKKLNLAFSLNKVKINGEYFASTGEEFKPTRPTNQVNQNGYWAIDVQKNDNYNFTQYKTGTPPPNTFKVIALSLPYPGNTGPITINNVFKNRFTLTKVNVTKNTASYIISIGTSAPVSGVYSNDIATFNIPVGESSTEINHAFGSAQTVYIGIPTGTSADIDIEYVDYTAPNYTPPVTTTKWVENTLYTFVETTPTLPLSTAFNVATGLGKVGTDWENCVLVGSIADNTDIMGNVIEAWDPSKPSERGVPYGNKTMLLTKAELPNIALPIRIDSAGNSGGSNDSAAINQGDGHLKANLKAVQLDGGETPFSLVQLTTRQAMFYYIKP